ncbi:MAG: glycogen/starch synthase [Elusimicrobiales bacterium]
MNIILAASEVFPFCKTGGLADVAGALAQVFSRTKDNRLVVFVPKYRNIGGGMFSLKAVPGSFSVPMTGRLETASLLRADWGKATVYFVDCPKYFDRAELYRTKYGDYQDNDERFIFFSRAVLEGAKFIDFKPDIIHCHDWQTGLIPAYLKTLYRIDAFFAKTGSLFTIHNMAFQGCFPRDTHFRAGFGWIDFTPDKLEFYGGINFLKSGIVFGDRVNTVSPGYADEVRLKPEFGRGLEGVLRARGADFSGILNGIDTEIWDPEMDAFIPRGYDFRSFSKGKAAARTALRARTGLAEDKAPLVGIVSRLEGQKGSDIIAAVMPNFAARAQFALLGCGDPHVQDTFAALERQHPGRISCCFAHNEELAHIVYAASDIFLMPSRFEPCGLSQMIAMRYGAPPVVTRTGGLADTVSDAAPVTGYFAADAQKENVTAALSKAICDFSNRRVWGEVVRNGMKRDFSWDSSAAHYLALFSTIHKLRR